VHCFVKQEQCFYAVGWLTRKAMSMKTPTVAAPKGQKPVAWNNTTNK